MVKLPGPCRPPWWRMLAVTQGVLALVFLWAAVGYLHQRAEWRAFTSAASAALALHMAWLLARRQRAEPPVMHKSLVDRMAFLACYLVFMAAGMVAALSNSSLWFMSGR